MEVEEQTNISMVNSFFSNHSAFSATILSLSTLQEETGTWQYVTMVLMAEQKRLQQNEQLNVIKPSGGVRITSSKPKKRKGRK